MHGAQMRRRKKPYDPAEATRVHDRRSTDLLRNAQASPEEIEDPYERGAIIVVMRSHRDDPLGKLKAHGHIDPAQYAAGRQYQEDFEAVEKGPCAIDPQKEAVDGGRMPEPITDQQQEATKRLNVANRMLGQDRCALVMDVLIHRRTMEQIAVRRDRQGKYWEEKFGAMFRGCLDLLAVEYGLAMRSRQRDTYTR